MDGRKEKERPKILQCLGGRGSGTPQQDRICCFFNGVTTSRWAGNYQNFPRGRQTEKPLERSRQNSPLKFFVCPIELVGAHVPAHLKEGVRLQERKLFRF